MVAADSAGLPVLAWALPEEVAEPLNAELGTCFIGRRASEIDLAVDVDRTRQPKAISTHASQSTDNATLWRRLELRGTGRPFAGCVHRPQWCDRCQPDLVGPDDLGGEAAASSSMA